MGKRESRITLKAFSLSNKRVLPLSEMGETMGRGNLGETMRNSVLGMISVRCLFDIQVEMSSRQLDL